VLLAKEWIRREHWLWQQVGEEVMVLVEAPMLEEVIWYQQAKGHLPGVPREVCLTWRRIGARHLLTRHVRQVLSKWSL
jgi:hypothetical protein